MGATLPYQQNIERIVLTGFMGCGKTTVGRRLAARLGWRFADLDDSVEARAGRTVPQIFAEHGEAAFRVAETRALADLLQQTHIVIALGGGAPETAANRELLAGGSRTFVVHLAAPFAALYERCAAQALNPHATARPLLGERAAAEKRYTERRELYTAIAHGAADAMMSPEAIVEAMLAAMPLHRDSLF